MSNNFTPRFDRSQVGRTLVHPTLPRKNLATIKCENGGISIDNAKNVDPQNAIDTGNDHRNVSTMCQVTHRFVICADTQYGMMTDNDNWDTEIEYSRKAIRFMNRMHPRPAFCCVCGDLTDMDRSFEVNKTNSKFTMDECDEIQLRQRRDFKRIWSGLHEDIALVCLCGNHDVGNRPTKRSMELYRKEFGDDYLAFWSAPNVYNIFVNTTLFSDPSGDEVTEEMARDQFRWVEERLKEARLPLLPEKQSEGNQPIQQKLQQPEESATKCQPNDEAIIFVFGHHPWFLYDENEEPENMTGFCEWNNTQIPDGYFVIPKERRIILLELFRRYGVSASFSGHFHQNLVSETSFGMKMIITAPLAAILESTGKKEKKKEQTENLILDEPDTQGVRVVEVLDDGSFRHEFISIEQDS